MKFKISWLGKPFCFFLLGLLVCWACHPFPEAPSRPFLQGNFDTINRFKPLIIPGDSIVLHFGYSSADANNTLIFGAFRWPSQFREYSGPDTAFSGVVKRFLPMGTQHDLMEKIGIDPSVLPGSYRFFGLVRDADGNTSDSARFDCFILNPDYPDLALDTPVNGLAALNILSTQAFPFRFRAVGNGLSFLQIQWYDSTKTVGLAPSVQFPLRENQPVDTVRGILEFPAVSSRNVFLRAILSTRSQRTISWWVPFRKNF